MPRVGRAMVEAPSGNGEVALDFRNDLRLALEAISEDLTADLHANLQSVLAKHLGPSGVGKLLDSFRPGDSRSASPDNHVAALGKLPHTACLFDAPDCPSCSLKPNLLMHSCMSSPSTPRPTFEEPACLPAKQTQLMHSRLHFNHPAATYGQGRVSPKELPGRWRFFSDKSCSSSACSREAENALLPRHTASSSQATVAFNMHEETIEDSTNGADGRRVTLFSEDGSLGESPKDLSAKSSPSSWEFEIRTEWRVAGQDEDIMEVRNTQFLASARSKAREFDSDPSIGVSEFSNPVIYLDKGWHLAANPSSPTRSLWEVFGLVLVLYDLVAIPLLMAFRPPPSFLMNAIDWITLVFWTLNVPMALTTGYIAKGVFITDLTKIFMQYAKTWLVIDAVTVTNHWLFMISSFIEHDNHKGESWFKLFRILRLLRLTRLLRIIRLGRIWALLHEVVDSESTSIFCEVVRLLVLLTLVNHFIACLWYTVGTAGSSGSTWVKYYKYTTDDVAWEHQYLVAYHWSVTQYTPATMHVQPQNMAERSFAIFCVMSGLIGFSYLFGSINLLLGRLRLLGEEKAKSFRQLQKYLKKNSVPIELSTRIRTYVETRYDMCRKHERQADVALLQLLSAQLASELACAVHGPTLAVHPLFGYLRNETSQTFRRLALKGASPHSFAPRDVLFSAGEHATHMYIVVAGTLRYEPMNHRNCQSAPEEVRIDQDWVAEPVLWTQNWNHVGDLVARTSIELLMIAPENFHAVTKSNPLAHYIVTTYANEYVTWLNGRQEISDVTKGPEVHDELTEFCNPSNAIHAIGLTASENKRRRSRTEYIFQFSGFHFRRSLHKA